MPLWARLMPQPGNIDWIFLNLHLLHKLSYEEALVYSFLKQEEDRVIFLADADEKEIPDWFDIPYGDMKWYLRMDINQMKETTKELERKGVIFLYAKFKKYRTRPEKVLKIIEASIAAEES